MWEDIRSLMKILDISEASEETDVVKAVGHGNTLLRQIQTARNFRSEIIFRDQTKKQWQATLSNRMAPDAKSVAKRIMAEHKVPEIDPEIVRQGDVLIENYVKKT